MSESTESTIRPLVGYDEAQAAGRAFARKHWPRLHETRQAHHEARVAARIAAKADAAIDEPTYAIAFLTGWITEFAKLEFEGKGA